MSLSHLYRTLKFKSVKAFVKTLRDLYESFETYIILKHDVLKSLEPRAYETP